MAYDDYQDFPQPPGTQLVAGAPAPAPASKTSGDQIHQWYQQYTGRAPEWSGDPTGAVAWNSWSNMDPGAAETGIKNSDEAQAYAKRGAAPAASMAPTFGGYGGGNSGVNPQFGALRSMLTSRAGQSLAVDPNDPVIKSQSNAYAADQTRSMRQYLQAMAEKAGPNANIGAETRHAYEVAGRNTSANTAGLLGNERDARRKEIADSLSGLYGVLSLEEQSRLRAEDQSLARDRFGADTTQQAWDDNYKTIFG